MGTGNGTVRGTGPTYDYVVIGAGSAGCAVAAGLADHGRVLVIEAGPSDRWPLVRMPFGLIWMMGSRRRDWRYRSTPQAGLNGRQIAIPRGRMLGGSGSINSMVWFRGRPEDFDGWQVPGWTWTDVAPAFDAVEAEMRPARLGTAHPLSAALHRAFGHNTDISPSPDRASAGLFQHNMARGRRRSPADAYLHPAAAAGNVTILQGTEVAHIGFTRDTATSVHFKDGAEVTASKGIILSAGSIGSPAILMASGLGPKGDLHSAGIDARADMPGIGANLHDHPGVGLHFAGPGSGYGLSPDQWPLWAAAPLTYLFGKTGPLASPTCEAGAFFNARGDGGAPDIQTHFIPFHLDPTGNRYALKRGYFADACLCRPASRGALRLSAQGLAIDLGLFSDPADLETLTEGWMRLRRMMAEADLGPHQAPEVYPAGAVTTEDEARAHIRDHAGTAYHPVGTLRMGTDDAAPVSPALRVKGVRGLWVADASIMPQVTSANTNAPSIMIGHRAASFVTGEAA